MAASEEILCGNNLPIAYELSLFEIFSANLQKLTGQKLLSNLQSLP
jgi:hypothetical protein